MYRFMAPLILTLLLGCGTARAPSDGEAGASFPHAEGYWTPARHGEDAVALDAGCETCHAVDVPELAEGDVEPSVPACRTCHAGYPHEDGFAEGSAHGSAWGSSCYGCHGELGDHVPAGLTEAMCVTCHETYPHASGWMRADHHGMSVLESGDSDACETCHSDTTLCTTCHESYPHADNWMSVHGDFYEPGACGTACHDGATELPGDIMCSACHGGD